MVEDISVVRAGILARLSKTLAQLYIIPKFSMYSPVQLSGYTFTAVDL